MTYNVYTNLIESVVEPFLNYCSGIWRHNKFSEIDAAVTRASDMFLGVTKTPQTQQVEVIWVAK